jgi:mRNA-degrading endonuclease toxin of MazEF toxin-antitoxin module
MDALAHEHPRRGDVYLASVPFTAKKMALRAVDRSERTGYSSEGEAGFVAEIQFKLRPVLVVQSDTITAQPGYDYVLTAPIYTVKEQHRAKDKFELLVSHRLPQVFYLDRREQGVTRPSYVALAQLQLLHRSVLKEKRGALTAAEMQQIDERLRFCLGL